MENIKTPHTADWKLGYAEQALKQIFNTATRELEPRHPEQMLAFISDVARIALENIK